MGDKLFFDNIKKNFKSPLRSGGKLRLRRKQNDQLTDSPRLARSLYTSDESDDERLKTRNQEQKQQQLPKMQHKNVINDLFITDSSDSPKQNAGNVMSRQSFDTIEGTSSHSNEELKINTVVNKGAVSNVAKPADERTQKYDFETLSYTSESSLVGEVKLCSIMNEMQMQEKENAKCSEHINLSSHSLSFGESPSSSKAKQLAQHNSRSPLQEIKVRTPVRKSLFKDPDVKDVNVNKDGKPFEGRLSETDGSSVEEIEILDSEEEKEISRLGPAELHPSSSYINCSSSIGSKSDFFNNIPEAAHAVSHSFIQKYKNNQIDLPVRNSPKDVADKVKIINKSVEEDIRMESTDDESFAEDNGEIVPADNEEDIVIGPTDESGNGEEVIDLTLDDSGQKQASIRETPSNKEIKLSEKPSSATVKSSSSKKKKSGQININIRVGLKISIRENSDSEKEDSQSSASSNDTEQRESYDIAVNSGKNATYVRKTRDIRISTTKVDNENAMQQQKVFEMKEECEEFHTPVKQQGKDGDVVIDDEMENLLTTLYGNGWKTPTFLSSCKSKKFRENLRKSLHANNFESFIKNISSGLDSTRISSSSSQSSQETIKAKVQSSTKKSVEKDKKQNASIKSFNHRSSSESGKSCTDETNNKTPIRKHFTPTARSAIKETPKYLDICDPETSTEDDESDDDFNPNDTWNASSDEDYETEKDRIAKRQSMIFDDRKKKNEIIFVKNNSIEEDKEIEDLLKKYQYKKPEQVGSETKKISKRKLFNPSYSDDEEELKENKREEEEAQKKVSLPPIFKIPTVSSDKKKETTPRDLKRTPSTPKTVKSTNQLTSSEKKEIAKKFSPLSFLRSLDASTNTAVCDREALYYRNNYKSKKQELAEKLFKLYNERVFNSKLSNVPFKWNKKLLTTGGRCNNSRRGGVRQSLIELSEKVLTSADRLRCTLIHEMCHAAAWILDGENGHGKTWKKYTSRANSVFPELPKINVCHSYVIEYRYTYLCISCKAKSLAHSKTKKVEEIRCSICKGNIELFENKKNERGEIEMVPVQKKEASGFAKFVQLKFKEVKTPYKTHQEVMKQLSTQFKSLSVEERALL